MTIINRITAYLRRPTQRQIIAELQHTIRAMQFRYDEDLSAYHAEVKRSRAKVERLDNALHGDTSRYLMEAQVCIRKISAVCANQERRIDKLEADLFCMREIMGQHFAADMAGFGDKPNEPDADNVTPLFPQRSFANTNTPNGAA